jgi:glycosyltransferase involved in cell wall biosynthesis
MGIVGIFNLMEECWAVNQTIAELFRGFGVKRPVVVFNNATDLLPLPFDFDQELRTLHNIAPNDPIFLFVGRIDPIKNIFFIIDALKILKDRGQSFKMLFVGSGPATADLQIHIDECHLSENVILVGRVMDRTMISRYFRLADLFLFPSLYDASSLVQIEAASQSTPALFLSGAATADAIVDGVNGYLSENSPQAFADKIVGILADPDSLQRVSVQAKTDLYRSWDATVKVAYERYRELIEKKVQKPSIFFPECNKQAD